MTYPSSDVNTTNADAGTDSPATFRTDVLDLITKFNLLRNHISTFVQGLLTSANAAAARGTLGAAASGANTDITSVSAAGFAFSGAGGFTVNSTTSINTKIALKDNGTVVGYLGAGPSTAFHVINSSNSAYCLNVDNSGNVSIPGNYNGNGSGLTGTAASLTAGAANNALGVGQGYQNMGRTFGSTITNSTGRTIYITATAAGPLSGSVRLDGYIGGGLVKQVLTTPPSGQGCAVCIDLVVQPGATYRIDQVGNAGGATPVYWYELR